MLKLTKQNILWFWGTLGTLILYSLPLNFVLACFVCFHVLWQRQTSSSVCRLEWFHFKMVGEKFERVHKGTTKTVKNLEGNNPKERLRYLVCSTEHAAVPNLALRPPIPHVVTESQSNSGCKVSQDVSGPTSCSQQDHFEVRLSCPGLHKAGSWKVPGMENSGALSGFSLLQIFSAYGFRGVVIV